MLPAQESQQLAARPVLPVATEAWILAGAFVVYLWLAVSLMRWSGTL